MIFFEKERDQKMPQPPSKQTKPSARLEPPQKKLFPATLLGYVGIGGGRGIVPLFAPHPLLSSDISRPRVIILLLGGKEGRGRLHPSPQGKIPKKYGR